ncbi:MAG: PEP-CTERM system histidine kinase PrsK [Pirellulales bacterium]|nr:PEP-CTERM system histidine kinase PrsK [Pirellulales bacterium]
MLPLPVLLAFTSAGVCGLFAIVHGALTLLRQRRSVARWAFSGSMAILCVESIAAGLSTAATDLNAFLYWHQFRLVAFSFLPGSWIVFSLCYARGENRGFLYRWRWSLAIAFAAPLFLAIFYGDGYILFRQLRADKELVVLLGWPGQATHFLMILGSVLSLMNLERTYRAAVGTMRWQVKYMLLGLGTLFIARFYTSSQALLYANVHTGMDTINSIGIIVSSLLILRALVRKGNFDIELYPSHEVISNSITILLAGIYLLAVGVLAKIVTLIGGDIAFPLKALGVLVALVLLATLLQSDRFRLHLKQFVSRHFKRPMHDYRTVWKRFTEETASHVRQEELCRSSAALISEIFEALSVSIWVMEKNNRVLELAASTRLAPAGGDSIELSKQEAEALAEQFRGAIRPIELDRVDEPWAKRILEANPKEFAHGGSRIGIPMTARNSLLGLIVVSDRVDGIPFSEQEFDVLGSVGAHTASNLLNRELSNKLVESKELEAFQTMAAFFVHDLKNAASTLNIMVKNLPKHWENPDFREDALRGISKTSERINDLIARLGTVRAELNIETAPTALDDFVASTLESWPPPENVTLDTQLVSKVTAPIDKDQLGSVLLNLVINASEAMAGAEPGHIKVSTALKDSSATIEVRDNGCGMSHEFIQKRLFRPFQTTKQSGIGIGMFQSKMIVEAHGGSLEVDSAKGMGTRFTILIPLEVEKKR